MSFYNVGRAVRTVSPFSPSLCVAELTAGADYLQYQERARDEPRDLARLDRALLHHDSTRHLVCETEVGECAKES